MSALAGTREPPLCRRADRPGALPALSCGLAPLPAPDAPMQQFAPETEQQAVELVRWAAAAAKRLTIQGNNTRPGFGMAMETDLVLSLKQLTGILEYHPEELVMRALPGTPLKEIEQALAEHGQQLAFEPPALNRLYQTGSTGTIGGVFMGNLAGPRRFKAGSARDHILGIRAINGRAELWKSGGVVIKNVSGYDMSKLLTGSWGTLSVVTELAFKTLPAPACSLSLAFWGLTSEQGLALLTEIAGMPYDSSGLAYLPAGSLRTMPLAAPPGKDTSLTLVRLEGTQVSVRARQQALQAGLSCDAERSLLEQPESEAIWAGVRELAPLQDTRRTPVVLRLALPPANAARLCRLLKELEGCQWYLDAAGNWLWVGLDAVGAQEKIARIRGRLGRQGGSSTLYRAPAALRQRCGIYCFPDASVRLLNQRLKHSFDPAGLFNPGRLWDTADAAAP